jgi:hypothetical protein
MTNRKLIELVISDTGGVDKISLVEEPAIEIDFMYFKKELEKYRFDNDLQIVIGPAMIPDMKIVRIDDSGNYYDVIFSKETILKIAKKFMKEARTNDINQDHENKKKTGTYVYESWIVEDEHDKAIMKYGYDVPVGTWMVSMQVEDLQTWQRVKNGELKGFSVEGVFEEFENEELFNKIKGIVEFDEDKAIEIAKTLGIKASDMDEFEVVEYDENFIPVQGYKEGLTVYKYDGPPAERTFCKTLLSLETYFTFAEIQAIAQAPVNPGFGPRGTNIYDIWKYSGGANCKHFWRKYYINAKEKVINKGRAPGLAGTAPYDQPNHGFLPDNK